MNIMSKEKRETYKAVKEKAEAIIRACDHILGGETETKSCVSEGISAWEFRRFCTYKIFGEKPTPKIKEWDRSWREELLHMISGEDILPADDFDEVYAWAKKEVLPQREAEILEMSINSYTLENIGKKHGITKERVRQIIEKAIRRLRRPDVYYALIYGKNYMDTLRSLSLEADGVSGAIEYFEKKQQTIEENNAQMQKRIKEKEEFIERQREILEKQQKNTGKDNDILSELATISLTDMGLVCGLSVRTYTCLWRAGIRTVADIVAKSVEDIRKIRNMGNKSLEEILDALKTHYGVDMDCVKYFV